MNPEYSFVDLQGFYNYKNDFIVKEFAIATKDFTQIYLVKPPYNFSTLTDSEKRQVRWLERNRGIYWREGFVDYLEFKRLIKPVLLDKTLFVKGYEKINWVKKLSPFCSVIDIEEQGCPNLETLCKKYDKDKKFNCFNHKNVCALKNVLCVKRWYYDNLLGISTLS